MSSYQHTIKLGTVVTFARSTATATAQLGSMSRYRLKLSRKFRAGND